MAPKRPSDGDLNQVNKITRVEQGIPTSPLTAQQRTPGGDYSGSVKRRLADSKRTGQACDRCKVRKIRCDGRPEGCSPCAQNRTACKTTDRITGRATIRGHTEAMEGENTYLRAQVATLLAQLKDMGVEPRTVPGYNTCTPGTPWSASSLGNEASGWNDSERRESPSPLPGYAAAAETEATGSLPLFKQSSIGDNYLGVCSADSLLSHIKGTSLSVFGSEIDITDFVDNDEAYDQSVMSYNHVLRVALSGEHVDPVPLPPYQKLLDYANWYMRSLNPYTMLLYKPTFMALIWRIGNEPNVKLNPADTVSVHMMLATIMYQISVRNAHAAMTEEARQGMLQESHNHYRYALSFFSQLIHGHKLQDVQALTLLCHHLRNFPKPGAAWIMTSTTFLLAIELGLHRSTKAWPDHIAQDPLEVETRKRVFWTLHALIANLGGKLGRPLPLSVDDIDVEFPEPLNDCLSGEDNGQLSPFRQCSFQVGIQISKYTIWSSELYKTIYAVRQSPRAYLDTLRRLEVGIQQWKDELPAELSDPSRASQDDYIFSLYLENWHQEYQLLLHHPSVCRSTDPEVINSNFDKCLQASEKLLAQCNEMIKMRSLDIPWINTVVYIAAIFTTLFIYTQRKAQLSPTDMGKLRQDMDQWINVMGECGQLLDSRDKLKQAIRSIVDRALGSIDEGISKRTATESLARVALQTPQEPIASVSTAYGNGNNQNNYRAPANTQTGAAMPASSADYIGLSPGAHYSYSSGSSASIPQHQSSTFGPQSYNNSEDPGMPPSHAAALAAAASGATPQPQRPTNNYAAYAGTQVPNNGHPPSYPNEWRQWTRTYMQPDLTPPGEYLNTASTLMALGGGREAGSQSSTQDGRGAVGASPMQGPGPSHYQWPGVLFGVGGDRQ